MVKAQRPNNRQHLYLRKLHHSAKSTLLGFAILRNLAMTDPRNPSSSSKKLEVPITSKTENGGANFSGQRTSRYLNPPDATNPDAATLREQWRYAIRLYSKWYSHTWGTAILAGVSFFALGWVIKGENPITSLKRSSSSLDGDSKSSVSEAGSDG